ncbi:hypothetical protein [Symmachiella dynata]|uniref:hypothetical protein n=1 Tax=Symmachiella dynata TaxID=2527995 RepID=UPI0030EE3395
MRFDDEQRGIAERIRDRLMDHPGITPKASVEQWANEIRLLMERDGRSAADVQDLFEWANNDDFWAMVVLSPQALRKNWEKIHVQRKQRQTGGRRIGDGLRYNPKAIAEPF